MLILKFNSVSHIDIAGDTTKVVELYKNHDYTLKIISFLKLKKKNEGSEDITDTMIVTMTNGETAKKHLYGVCGAD